MCRYGGRCKGSGEPCSDGEADLGAGEQRVCAHAPVGADDGAGGDPLATVVGDVEGDGALEAVELQGGAKGWAVAGAIDAELGVMGDVEQVGPYGVVGHVLLWHSEAGSVGAERDGAGGRVGVVEGQGAVEGLEPAVDGEEAEGLGAEAELDGAGGEGELDGGGMGGSGYRGEEESRCEPFSGGGRPASGALPRALRGREGGSRSVRLGVVRQGGFLRGATWRTLGGNGGGVVHVVAG